MIYLCQFHTNASGNPRSHLAFYIKLLTFLLRRQHLYQKTPQTQDIHFLTKTNKDLNHSRRCPYVYHAHEKTHFPLTYFPHDLPPPALPHLCHSGSLLSSGRRHHRLSVRHSRHWFHAPNPGQARCGKSIHPRLRLIKLHRERPAYTALYLPHPPWHVLPSRYCNILGMETLVKILLHAKASCSGGGFGFLQTQNPPDIRGIFSCIP